MKVILLRDVAKMGRRYDVVEVPGGHALNFLIPRKMAEPATPDNMKRIEEMKRKHSAHDAADLGHFKSVCESLSGKRISLSAGANAQGHLYEGVKAEHIIRELKNQGYDVPSEALHLEKPLKELGEHTLTLRAHGVEGSLTLVIQAA
jgi:large subunit ribosomal protein L9